jgi:hypothetical protein
MIDEQTEHIEKSGKPRYHKNDVQGFNNQKCHAAKKR